MKEFWIMIQTIFTGLGGWIGYYLGGCDGLLYALIAFAIVDYLTGVMCAIADKKLSSTVGFKGICRKVFIFFARRYCQHSRHAGDRTAGSPTYRCDLFLSFQ